MKQKLINVLIIIGLLLGTVACGEPDLNKINYLECRWDILKLSKIVDSDSDPDELSQKIREICINNNFQSLDAFIAAREKYKDEFRNVKEEKELSNFLKQIPGEPSDVSRVRAVSLKALQQKLKEYHGKPLPQNISQFCGLNEITGYAVDAANRDIVLIGNVDNTLPPLYLQDFVVALRNAWLKYAELKNNVYHYSNPGCTIDPDPKVLKKLDDVKKQINHSKTTAGIEKAIERWKNVCKAPQKVGVFGIPFDTRFARVMVKADYDMKRLVNGSDSLDIPGFSSLVDTELEQAKKEIINEGSISVPLSGLNRFWFHPGETQYLEDDGMVVIDRCSVVLLTESEHLTQSGKVVGTGHANPYAKKFTDAFSAVYSQIARRRPIYHELENLFRFVALAKLLKLKSSHTEIGTDLDYLLNQFPVPSTPVDGYLPGRSNVKGFKHRKDLERGIHTFQVWLPTCGGVSIDIDVNQNDINTDQTNNLKQLKKIVFRKRPSSDALAWDLKGLPKRKSPEPTGHKNLHDTATFIVENRGTNYAVYNNSAQPVYEGPNKLQLLKKVVEQLSDESTLRFDLENFTEKDAGAFSESIKVIKETLKMEPSLMLVHGKTNAAKTNDYLSPPREKIKFSDGESSVEKVTQGKFKGRFRAVFNVKAAGDKTKKFVIHAYSKSKENLSNLFEKIRTKQSSTGSLNPLEKDIIDSVNELKKNRRDKENIEIIIEFFEQVLEIDISLLVYPYIKRNRIVEATA